MSTKRSQAAVPLADKHTAKNKRLKFTSSSVSDRERSSTTVVNCVEEDNLLASKHATAENAVYVSSLRRLLVERLKDEEEFERLTMYGRDVRFNANGGQPKWQLGRLVLDMLHCPMRMNEKVLFMLYFAAMNRCATKREWAPLLDAMSAKVRDGSLAPSWTHTLLCVKTKSGGQAPDKLQPFKMQYDVSKRIFNYKQKDGFYELIDMALGPDINNNDWRVFLISYLNCLELLTMNRDYKNGEIDELERRCDKMYTCLVTKIGGLESVTNYFHYVGSGHVVCMIRMYGNLWRYRNEGVEAFNKIVSLRHNKFNQQCGCRKTCKGMPKALCPEFWSLGQWLGRWSMWNLGYGDSMDPERICKSCDTTPTNHSDSETDSDTDDSYQYASSSESSMDSHYDSSSESDNDSYFSDGFEPCTPLNMSMSECRSRNLFDRECVRN